MQIVIDISKEKYDKIMAMDWVNGRRIFDEETRAVHDGKVLPKGHGRLIDEREVYKKFYCRCLARAAKEVLDGISTIIEADKAEREDKA